ncbi:hypothetical protein FKG94_23850 [Exilibacterium tricleocarpae]|uniref:Pectinacetylesterase n=2 Tax=Exilibacterium tricleocarpae TaxID=2591008 RepID=A0A545ST92_9GAMM|nr:hypothetical protein FKG94_23850 [Exilibacterium tricleocarpae]
MKRFFCSIKSNKKDTAKTGTGILTKSLLAAFVPICFSPAAFSIGIEDVVDGGNDYAWEKVEIPGTVCSDGSQYKFWVHDAPSNNLLILFEGGGACWDYESCSGALGILGAANPNGLPDDYITQFKARFVSPLVNGADPGLPFRPKSPIATNGWDVVYMPYCTGDVHTGNMVRTYEDPTGANPPITFRHMGYHNTIEALDWLAARFPSINKLLVTGFSAGGVASAAGYYFAKRTLNPTAGYMLNDSGPLFPAPNASFKSRQLHDTIRVAWGLDDVLSTLPASFDINDFGSATAMVSIEFPNDQLAYTAYSSDFNFSRFSYERFFPGSTQADILDMWREDQANLVGEMDQRANFSYHIPWQRPINDSHCSTIITFVGSHVCPSIRKKRWYEYFEFPFTQSWKCPEGLDSMEAFLDRWIDGNEVIRDIEPENNYNNEDPGMQIISGPINDAL